MLTIENPTYVAKALIRPMIKAPEGHSLIVSDYAGIENRILAWLAQDTQTLEDFKNGIDQYITMASARYGIPYETILEGHEREDKYYSGLRQMGKVIILGCIAEGTLVLTDKGPVPIQDVTLLHKLWDGESWVTHGGLLNKGLKKCYNFADIWLTEDHEIFLSETKEAVCPHLGSTHSEQKAICLAIGKFLSTYQEELRQLVIEGIESSVRCVEKKVSKLWETLNVACQLNAALAVEKLNTNLIWSHIVRSQVLIRKLLIDLSIDGTPLKPDALCRLLVNTKTTEDVESGCVKNGLIILNHLLSMLVPSTALTIQTSSLTESTMKDIMSLEISSSAREVRTCLTHDILNAGKNHRFTLLAPKGPVLVSNCGYQMGHKKFKDTAWNQFKLEVSLEESDKAVKAYRAKYYLVKELWDGLKNAASKTVLSGQQITYKRITFGLAKVKGIIWLAMKLPSGKCIYYMDPKVKHYLIPDYEQMGPVPCVTHLGTDPDTKHFTRLRLTPGRITENATQGSAREVMGQGMQNIRDHMPEVKLIASVHDEALGIIKNEDIKSDTLDRFNFHLCDIDWAPDAQLSAKGWIGQRYRK